MRCGSRPPESGARRWTSGRSPFRQQRRRWEGRCGWPAGWPGWSACGLLAWLLGRLAARSAPAFLGPTAVDRLALAEARLAAEAEHTRLARDLHDGIGHALTIITVQTAAGRRVLEDDPATAARALAAAEEVARGALEELDSVLAALRDPGERTGPEPGWTGCPPCSPPTARPVLR